MLYEVITIKAGRYDFGEPATPGRVLDRLVAGDVRRQRLTIPEGFSLVEIAARLEEEGVGHADTFLRLARDPDFIASLGIDSPSLEGYLFPDTYLFDSGTSEERLIRSMVRRFENRLAPDLVEGAAKAGLDAHQLVTLASIIVITSYSIHYTKLYENPWVIFGVMPIFALANAGVSLDLSSLPMSLSYNFV